MRSGVGLSNICYTVLDEIMECIFWRFPSKRSHWEAVIISIIISFELYSEIFKREETMRGIKAFVILAMTAFYFPIVSWGKGRIFLCLMPNSFSFTLKKSKVFVKPCFGESFSEFGAVICLHTFNRHRESLNEMHQKYHGRVGAVLFKGFHITPA